jgi:formate hydrogenlyase transcriptional activator
VITTQGTILRLAERIDDGRDPARNIDSLSISDVEREHILMVMAKTGWRIEGNKGAAALLDMNPSTLRSRMQKLGISRSNQNSNL